jgi:RecB family exonuclease
MTEARQTISIAGLQINLRLDRVDRLIDGSPLVIDYKTGTIGPDSWDLPRPDDVQLPLYKVFGLGQNLIPTQDAAATGGLVFAKVRPGEACFAGRVADPKATLIADLKGTSSLAKRKLTSAEESAWRVYIEQLALDFLHGRANVDPREYPKTCERCGLQSVCRVREIENHARFEREEDLEDDVEASE